MGKFMNEKQSLFYIFLKSLFGLWHSKERTRLFWCGRENLMGIAILPCLITNIVTYSYSTVLRQVNLPLSRSLGMCQVFV